MPIPMFDRIEFVDSAGIGTYTVPVYAVVREIVLKNSGDAQEQRDIWMIAQQSASNGNAFARFRISKASGWELITDIADDTPTELAANVETLPLISSYNVISEDDFNEIDALLRALVP